MRLNSRRLNRTLLQRQHLLERSTGSAIDLIERLIGLQAQESTSPYLALAARLEDFDPHRVTADLAKRRLVRLLTMRGTIHLLTPQDAVTLRPWVQPVMEAELRSARNLRSVRKIDRGRFDDALRSALVRGPLPQSELGLALTKAFPDAQATALGGLARLAAPLAQLPPRGGWKASGGVTYDYVDRWTKLPMGTIDVPTIVRRYLAAFGPASAADVTTWSGVTKLGPVLAGMKDLVQHQDEEGRPLFDLPDATLADEDTPAPIRLLGTYDNVWLSHAGRDRVTKRDKREFWMGANGGVANVILLDGWLEGLWRAENGRVQVLSMSRRLTKPEQAELDGEIARVEALLAR